jgi:SAM-dependent methyltransferase
MRRLAYHEALGVLGLGDLHPGGAGATDALLSELDRHRPRRMLEVGAGIGGTTARMLDRGWQVVSIEPNDVLRRSLGQRIGAATFAGSFDTFDDAPGSYDGVIGESVFYGMDLPAAFRKVGRLLRPGGCLALVDTVWTAAACSRPGDVAAIHDETKRIFGIPMASREALTWLDWKRILTAAGFTPLVEQRLGPPSARSTIRRPRTVILRGAAKHPWAFLQALGHRWRFRRVKVPPGWTETWLSVWQRV